MEQIISGDKAKMPMTERFYSVNGQMMGYESGGVKKDFLTDHLGSITAEIDQTQTRTYDTRYSAYGRNNWSTGTGCGFGWVGSYGYRETGLFHMSHYVRARHYSYVTGAWSTVDPLWPDESTYGYALSWPTKAIDPSGLYPRYDGCPPKFQENMNALCDRINHIGPANLPAIKSCISRATTARHHSCPDVSLTRAKCLKRWCNSDGEIQCRPSPPGSGQYGLCPRTYVGESEDPHDTIIINNNNPPYGFTYVDWVNAVGAQQLTVIHEVLHACGVPHVVQDKGGREQCNDIMACCIYEVVVGRNSGSKCWSRITPLPKPGLMVPRPGGGGPPLRLP
jgi:RHS repeat-associated protein